MIFCVETLGCKVNQFETQAIESVLVSRGHTAAQPGHGCDVCIINTCAVTSESARKSRQAVRRMKRLEPGAIIAVCGCLSQLNPAELEALGAELVGGIGGRLEFADDIERVFEEKRRKSSVGNPRERRIFEELPPGGVSGRTRALLKIQDGCDNFCSYCVIPYARGRSRSLPVAAAERQAAQLCAEGFGEIVITGIEISSYGKDLPGQPMLEDAVLKIAAAAPLARLRLGSLEPGVVTEDFCVKLSGIRQLCGHFHLSLQSGCDATLRRMNRKYDTAAVMTAISELRRYFPGCGITADLITGFPGETGEEFAKTLEFIKKAAFSNMHVFPYSPRPGTPAAASPGQIEKRLRRERAATVAALAENMALDFRMLQRDKVVEVLFEQEKNGFWHGYSGNYVEVFVENGGGKNRIYPVRIKNIENGLCKGEIVGA